MTLEPKSPFSRRVDRVLLGRLSEPMGSPGQCLAVYRLLEHPGWLFKQYRPDQLREADELRLSRLIALPDKLTAADRRLLLGHTCWPQSQVLDGRRTVGVAIPEAPERYFAQLRNPDGTRDRGALLLTQLAATQDSFERVGLSTPTLRQRLSACDGLIRVGDLLERHGLVYGDWGYKNIFWSQDDHSVYFIDVDACSFGPQPWVESFGFADPLTPDGQPVDTYTERFRCALAVAACLTGTRTPGRAISGLAQLSGDDRIHRLASILRQIAGSTRRSDRLPISELRKALAPSPPASATSASAPSTSAPATAAPLVNDGTNILSWEPVGPPPAHGRAPARDRTSSIKRPGGNAPWPGAAPPDYRPPNPASTTNSLAGTGSVSNTGSFSTGGTTPLVKPESSPSYTAAPRRMTSTTRAFNSGSTLRPQTSVHGRRDERPRRTALVVSLLLLLAVAGVTSLLVAVL